MSALFCPYQNLCSGCQFLDQPYAWQKQYKIENLQQLLNRFQILPPDSIQFVSAGENFLRDRLDFGWQSKKLGLYQKTSREIVDIETCLQLSLELQAWLTDFRQYPWPMEKASFRLRVSPHGHRGLWIDAANIDIKTLLDEGHILQNLFAQNVHIEMGQRRKSVIREKNQFKLSDPQHQVWFQSWDEQGPVDLYCQVASFTQPSLRANQLICETLMAYLKPLRGSHILEFGSGIGNLSFPALSHADKLTACEIDRLSLQGFERSLQERNLAHKVDIKAGDFQKKTDITPQDVILCNPPRSGLKLFLDSLFAHPGIRKSEYFVYMSCFPESLCVDLQRLQQEGFHLQQATIVDQFPQTAHYEVMCLLQRK